MIIKGSFTSTNDYINATRTHWAKGAKIKKEETEFVRLQAFGKKAKTPCKIHFTWYVKNSRKDPDGIAGIARKHILDGLVKAKVIPDDTMKYIKGFSDHFVVDKNERVEIEFEEVNDET